MRYDNDIELSVKFDQEHANEYSFEFYFTEYFSGGNSKSWGAFNTIHRERIHSTWYSNVGRDFYIDEDRIFKTESHHGVWYKRTVSKRTGRTLWRKLRSLAFKEI